jgi:Arc/MetJ family transcription regulator
MSLGVKNNMATNLAIDDRLLCEAVRVGKRSTKRETVNEALREYIDRRKRLKALDLFGTIDFDPRYDYKAERKKR